MTPLPPQALGAVIAAAVAGTLAFVGLLVSKEQKTSEFRQAWIDALRADLAEFLARANVVADAHTAGIIAEEKTDWSAIREDWIAGNNAALRIRLRLNPRERQSKILLDLLNELDENYLEDGKPNYELICSIEDRLVTQSHILLKKEWRRVKRGEPVFAIVKYSSGLFLLGGVIFVIYRWFTG